MCGVYGIGVKARDFIEIVHFGIFRRCFGIFSYIGVFGYVSGVMVKYLG